MILRKNILGLLVFLLLLTLSAQAQEANLIAQHIIQQLKAFPQEKTYMHTDATDYAIGDRIWVKVYVVNALMHEPTEESRYVYVELADNDGVVQNRVKLMNREGIYAGYVDIPTTAEGGKYFLRAYTELMGDTKGYEDVKCIYKTIHGLFITSDRATTSKCASTEASTRRNTTFWHIAADTLSSFGR